MSDVSPGRLPWVLLSGLAAAACSAGASAESVDAGTDAAFGHIQESGPIVVPPLSCGDAPCPDPDPSGPLRTRACCLPSGACGLDALALGEKCLEPGRPGSVDLSCPGWSASNGESVQGCCTPEGRCGLFDRTSGLGCVPPVDPADAPECVPSPDAHCTSIVELPCDGPEDCDGQGVCCGRYSPEGYDRFECHPTCSALSTGTGRVWFEICHAGGTCQEASHRCSPSNALPAFLARCAPADIHDSGTQESGADGGGKGDSGTGGPARDAGDGQAPSSFEGTTCGTVTCSAADKCCLLGGEPAYCSPRSTPCACLPGNDP